MPLAVLIISYIITPTIVYAAQSRVGLGTADAFAVLAGSGITNTGATTISGDVGTFPTTTETGFAGLVTFSSGANHVGDAVTQGAKNDLVTAYNDAAGRTPVTTRATDLAGATLTAGVYDSADTTFEITGGGTLTLDGGGDANAVFIFKMGTTLITSSSSKVVLTNSAQACNVYWQVGSSATLGTSTNFIGNILALTSITLNTSATVNGRVLARNGAVTMDTNTITRADCAAGTTGASAAAATSVLVNNTTSVPAAPYCPPLASTIVSPFVIESRRVSPNSIFFSWGPQSGTDLFNIQYGFEHGKWLYNVDVTGFSTTINDLPPNQPIWVQIAGRSTCRIGSYGVSKLIGGPKLPNTGLAPREDNISWYIPTGIFGISFLLILIQRNTRFSSLH
ncbi:MAG: ice-binding family protein [Candidatus Daviesbacteria bacterium]|nr:ice-binding family protein [Candidatus Daviesbacteria bacterium]